MTEQDEKMLNVIQQSDDKGNKAYTLTTWDKGIKYKPFTEKDELLMTSPNGTKFKLMVDDDGNLKAEKEETNDDKE